MRRSLHTPFNIYLVIVMNYKLFLDDERTPDMVWSNPDEWTTVKTFNEFVSIIEKQGLPGMISFDHDLAFEHYDPRIWRDGNQPDYGSYIEKTGWHCAQWLAGKGYDTRPVFIHVHSANPVGAQNIKDLLTKWHNLLKERDEKRRIEEDFRYESYP